MLGLNVLHEYTGEGHEHIQKRIKEKGYFKNVASQKGGNCKYCMLELHYDYV